MYLAASASGRRWAAWVAFGASFSPITLGKFIGFDATPWMLALAAALLVAGLVGRRIHAAWDVHHHRTGRVVERSLAEFCAVLDVLVAALVAVVALTA